MVHHVLYVVLGAAAGYAYYRFIGCHSGACIIGATPWGSTAYGAIVGLLMARQG